MLHECIYFMLVMEHIGTNKVKVRHEASRYFKKKRKDYLKANTEELETNSKVKNIRVLYRGINDFKKG